MIKAKSINLRERDELEPLLVANPDVIEQGLQIVSHQLMTDSRGYRDIRGHNTNYHRYNNFN